jgi:cellulose synthase/poly-beta-1,6-N-acetylglucosamine synthase-like glycosyltransferase
LSHPTSFHKKNEDTNLIDAILVFLYFLFTFLMLPYGYNCFIMVYFSRKYKEPNLNIVKNHNIVTIQLPIYNEKHVVERLIDAICGLDWPRDKLEILVLDDSTDETREIVDREVAARKELGINISIIRRPERVGYRAGALKNALDYTHGKYLAVIDADFVPPPDFLNRTVAAIEADPKIGIVQARWDHLNRDYSKFTEAFSLGIDAYHIIEQSARSAIGIVNFNGSAGLLRTEAIKDVGGWSWDILSEDIDISYRMQNKGWKTLYLRDLTVMGEIPPNMATFRTQQGRWARGSVQCAKKFLGAVWRSPRTLLQKVEASIHLTYYMVIMWMFIALLVTIPLLAMNKFPYITTPLYLGLFGVCTISSFALYYATIRWQKQSLYKKLPYIGLLALVGYGISAKVSLEMVKGLMRNGGHYDRVPKFNIVKKSDKIESSYSNIKELPWLEMFMLVYTSLGIMFAFVNGSWGIMLYLFVYWMGYFTVAFSITPL